MTPRIAAYETLLRLEKEKQYSMFEKLAKEYEEINYFNPIQLTEEKEKKFRESRIEDIISDADEYKEYLVFKLIH